MYNMNNLGSNTSAFCKYEILAEISLHNNTQKKRTIEVLCSRILAKHRPRNCKYINCSQEVESSTEDTTGIQEKLMNLSTDESQLHAKWYEYWGNNGENVVCETWIQQYGCCTMDDTIDIEELYKKHREEQYQILYWKFINEIGYTDAKIEEQTNRDIENDVENDDCSSNSSEADDDVNHISNFEFIYKYKNFKEVKSKLIKTYRALSMMGFTYNEQDYFDSAYVDYLKTNIIKSTRQLNVYKFPKMVKAKKHSNVIDTNLSIAIIDPENSINHDEKKQCGSSCTNNSLTNDSNGKKHKINKKTLKKEKMKQERDKRTAEELDKYGYSYLQNKPKLLKYWKKRHVLFSEFEKGIQLDEESWYSVTPEIISRHIAKRCSCYLIIDPFCGAGGNIIQFAKTCTLVIAIDNDPKKIEMARHNAELYGVADRIQFIIGDFFALAPTLKADVVFVSPPWGGPDFMSIEDYRLSDIMPDNGGGEHILYMARQITSNVALYLPKNINIFDCIQSAKDDYIEVEQNMLNSRYNSVTVYYSELYGFCEETFAESYDGIVL